MTTAGTDQTTWKDVSYNLSTGQYQSSSALLRQITNLQKYVCSKTINHAWSICLNVLWTVITVLLCKQKPTRLRDLSWSLCLLWLSCVLMAPYLKSHSEMFQQFFCSKLWNVNTKMKSTILLVYHDAVSLRLYWLLVKWHCFY